MPGTMDGIKLAHYIRGKWPPIKLLVVSGVPDGLHSQLPEGAFFLNKPFNEALLLKSVALTLGVQSVAR